MLVYSSAATGEDGNVYADSPCEWSRVGCLQEASELLLIWLIKREKDFSGELGGKAFPGGEAQHYECQDKGKASHRHSLVKRGLAILQILGKLDE